MDQVPQQMPLLIEDLDDAMREAIRAIGGAKRAGSFLWPEMDPAAAGRRLSDCLSSEKREKLAFAQGLALLREARRAGAHAAMGFVAGWCGYEDPRPIEPRDELAQLQREFLDGMRRNEKLAERLEAAMRAMSVASARHG